MQGTSSEIASMLHRLADAIRSGKSASIVLAGETVFIPADADIKVGYETGGSAREMTISVTWAQASVVPQLIRRHSEQVQDTDGHFYDVLIYGEPRSDGTWEAWLEFVPLSPTLPSRRSGRETTQPDRAAVEYWATGLEPLYLVGAFERAA
jgi:hypothetical protein